MSHCTTVIVRRRSSDGGDTINEVVPKSTVEEASHLIGWPACKCGMKLAIEGCAHGDLDRIYESIQYLENTNGIKLDLLICCGDFQATRNGADLKCMAVPQKYQKMCSFYKYYSGEKVAPVLTIFIGGNHEASNYLQELAYGGWVAPNIYYMGYAGIVNVAGVRIGGLSGIYKGHDYMKGHYEKPPYSEETKRSAYHVRNLEVFRLKQVKSPIDIFLSHDWPRGVYHHGNIKQLLKHKPFFEDEVNNNSLGSKPCEELLHYLKPTYWFSAHLHVKFAAIVHHTDTVVDIPHDSKKPFELEYDLEWLTIVYLTNHLLSVKKGIQYMPGPGQDERWIFTPTSEESNLVLKKFGNNLVIPLNFTTTVTSFSSEGENSSQTSTPARERYPSQPQAQINPQTMAFCERLSVDDPMALLLDCNNDSSLNTSQMSTCTLPSFLTPERAGNITNVSSSMLDDTLTTTGSESIELESTSKSFGSCADEVSFDSQSPSQVKRYSLVLPSPLNSDFDDQAEPVARKAVLPSVVDSDIDECLITRTYANEKHWS
uniref:Lariat debranching enzyme C-terminal domain-containing protein n=1 Tax=Timema bartmani TaxID=61472 RepID=A0A7R9ENK0_9NEOP|nr:unnamed protein product [Timema bartmani]